MEKEMESPSELEREEWRKQALIRAMDENHYWQDHWHAYFFAPKSDQH